MRKYVRYERKDCYDLERIIESSQKLVNSLIKSKEPRFIYQDTLLQLLLVV